MKPFVRHRGVAAPLPIDNVDTDQIIPSREMKRVSKLGLGDGLFAGSRYVYEGTERGAENPDFVLNRPEYRNASMLLSGRNFGCGSSREHAVWALADFGIRAILAQSFGRIFRSNCARNGLLAIELGQADIERILATAQAEPFEIDLEAQVIRLPDGSSLSFDVPKGDREMLLNGLDYVDYALQYEADIERHIAKDRELRPWAYLAPQN
ncbi:MAG: 3-isopropylmalate dehydratase small subunit [Pseudomonadota bacterium]